MKSPDKCLIAVTAGRWQTHGILKAKEMGYSVLGIDSSEDAEGLQYCDEKICHDFKDVEGIFKKLKNFNLNYVGAASFCSEAGMELASNLRERLGLPGPNVEVTLNLTKKNRQRDLWTKSKVPGPKWTVIQDMRNGVDSVKSFGFPSILKPVDSAGSRGIVKFENDSDITEVLIAKAFEFSPSKTLILESFMEGKEFTVETFSINGKANLLAITEKFKVEGTGGTVAKELRTVEFNSSLESKILNTVESALFNLGYETGVGHTEIMINSDEEVFLIECAGRGGGFLLSEKFVPAVSSIDVTDLTIRALVGTSLPEITPHRSHGVLRFFPSKEGKVTSISGFDKVNEQVGVIGGAFVKEGDILKTAISDGDRMGFVLTNHIELKKAVEFANEAEEKISFQVEVLDA